MSEEIPPLTRELGEDQPIVVTLDWEGDDVRWVNVEPEWYEQVGPAGLIGQVRRAYQAARPAPSNWRLEVSLGDVALEDLREFGLLLAEARASDPVSENREPIVVAGEYLQSLWSAEGALLRILDPHQWLPNAARQTLCEELTTVLQPPVVAKHAETPRVRRLLEFVGRK